MSKGETVTGRIRVSNRSRLPAARFDVELEYYNPEITARGRKILHGYMADRETAGENGISGGVRILRNSARGNQECQGV